MDASSERVQIASDVVVNVDVIVVVVGTAPHVGGQDAGHGIATA